MIISFYNEKFEGLQNNASLVVDNSSYSLIRRGVELDELICTCEAFTENIQPTFVVVKNDRGNYMYGALAGIPQLNKNNQTKITASDLKTMLKSDVVLDLTIKQGSLNELFTYVFNAWNSQVNQNVFQCQLLFDESVGSVSFGHLEPSAEKIAVYNAWTDIFAPYLKYYALFMTTELDLVGKRVIFRIGKSMRRDLTVKLWELGNYDYGKKIADINETQGCVLNTTTGELRYGTKWILTSGNKALANENIITNIESYRDIYPIKRKVFFKETDDGEKMNELMNEANTEACTELTNHLFQENLELTNIAADFETRFNIVVRRGGTVYKSLPCGELHYDSNGLKKVQVGYRFTGIQFLLKE